jgi:hypothetical protein
MPFLVIEQVDASDVGWEACTYQMLIAFEGDPKDEGRMCIGDTGPRQII